MPRTKPPAQKVTKPAAPHPDGATEDAAAALDALRRVVRALRVGARSVEERTGLRAAQLFTLQLVAASPGLSLSELARRTMTDRTSAAGMVERLLARGLVERRSGAADRRRTEIYPTPKGTAMLARAPRAPTQQVLDGLSAMSDRDRRLLARSLGALVRAMGIEHDEATMLFEDPPLRADRAVTPARAAGRASTPRRAGAPRAPR